MSAEPWNLASREHCVELTVDLGDRAYTIHVGRDLDTGRDPALADGRPVIVLTDENVLARHGDRIDRLLAGREGERIVVPAGENAKSFVCLEGVLERMAACGATRGWALVAFGGGVIGDLGGLAAALYMRGIDVVQAPTTLLAQVDSSVGGKTAVNLFSGKNLAGVFWQPRSVWADVGVLATLAPHEYSSGLGEVAKHALLAGEAMIEEVAASAPALLGRQADALERTVSRSVAVKIEHVVADEREAGIRAHLNLGHTVGHAIEHAAGLPHGVAVALGLLVETRLAEAMGVAEAGTAETVEGLLRALELPTASDLPPATALLELMKRDKKRIRTGQLTAALLSAPGAARVVHDLPENAVLASLTSLRS